MESILDRVGKYKTQYVTVTGGEPLAQKNCLGLLKQLCDGGYQVSLETSGALDVSAVDARVSRVMDIKTPASGECEKNRYENIQFLQTNDQIKFVLCNREDYDWAVGILNQYKLTDYCEVLFSPASGQLMANELADWIIKDQLNVRFQLQLHKILWGDEPGR